MEERGDDVTLMFALNVIIAHTTRYNTTHNTYNIADEDE